MNNMKLCAVIVVYGQQYDITSTFKSLTEIANNCKSIDLDVIIYDNSKVNTEVKPIEQMHVVYVHDKRNLGVVPAYIYAANYCRDNKIDWLLRLDQDSSFGIDLIEEFLSINNSNKYLAIVPKIICNNKIISPSIVHVGGYFTNISYNLYGISANKLTFINSMSFINVGNSCTIDLLNSLVCQLDLSDHEFALSLPMNSVFVMKSTVNHLLSIMEKEYVSVERYSSILESESYLIKTRETLIGKLLYRVRLLIRSINFCFSGKRHLALVTLRKIW